MSEQDNQNKHLIHKKCDKLQSVLDRQHMPNTHTHTHLQCCSHLSWANQP